MADCERRVRSANGTIPWHTDEEHGFTLLTIREWREAQTKAALPSSYADFYAARGICLDCSGSGAEMIAWSKPANELDINAAAELGLDELPLYDTCPTCNGTGRAARSDWRKSPEICRDP